MFDTRLSHWIYPYFSTKLYYSKIPIKKLLVPRFRKEWSTIIFPSIHPSLHRDNKTSCSIWKGMKVKYVETRVSVPDRTIPDYQIISPRAFSRSNLIRGNRFNPRNRIESCRCNGFGRNFRLRTTLRLTAVAGNDALQTLMRISPLGIPFNDAS